MKCFSQIHPQPTTLFLSEFILSGLRNKMETFLYFFCSLCFIGSACAKHTQHILEIN